MSETGETARARYTRAAFRALWFGAAPALLAGATWVYLVPAVGFLARVGGERQLPLLAGLFLLFALVARAWRAVLPGGRHLDPGPAPPRSRRRMLVLGLAVAVAAVGGSLVRASVAEPYHVLSTSMLPTLDPGDRILVDKLAFGLRAPFARTDVGDRLPRRGEAIVFRQDGGGSGPPALVKRVVGLPGDLVEVVMGRPVINGRTVPSCDAGLFVHLGSSPPIRGRLAVEFLDDNVYLTVLAAGTTRASSYRVGPGEVFVLGDNRDLSRDSRSLNDGRGGGVPVSAILGRAQRILFGTTHDGGIDWGRTWKTLGLARGRAPHLPGVDVRPLQAGIERCLRDPPRSAPALAAPLSGA